MVFGPDYKCVSNKKKKKKLSRVEENLKLAPPNKYYSINFPPNTVFQIQAYMDKGRKKKSYNNFRETVGGGST